MPVARLKCLLSRTLSGESRASKRQLRFPDRVFQPAKIPDFRAFGRGGTAPPDRDRLVPNDYDAPTLSKLVFKSQQQAVADKIGGPTIQAGGGIESIDENVGIQENHGSRVRTRSCSQFIFGVRAAEASTALISEGSGLVFLGPRMTLASS